jgi:hypothetical protein
MVENLVFIDLEIVLVLYRMFQQYFLKNSPLVSRIYAEADLR